MDKVAQGMGLGAAASVPVVGEMLKGLLGGVIESINEQKQIEDQCDSLREQLPELLEVLQKLATDDEVYQTLIEDVQREVEDFDRFVQPLEKTRKRNMFSGRRRKALRALNEVKTRIASFNEAMEMFKTRAMLRMHELVAQNTTKLDETKAIAVETSADVKTGNKKIDELSEVFQKLALTLDKRLANPEYVQNLRGGSGSTVSSAMYELEDSLKDLRSGSTKQKRDAQRELVGIALAFVRDINEYAVATGLTILDKLVGDASARRVVMKNPSVVRTLLGREIERPGDKTVRWMLEHLVEDSVPFFEQLEPLSKEPKYHSAIAGAGLIPWVVSAAKPTVMKSEDSQMTDEQIGDEDALRILVEIAKSNECKRAIAEAGGIAVLVADYQLLEMTEYAFDPIIVDVVGALAGFAEDATCREQFGAAHGEWTLLHFLWKCNTTETERILKDDDGYVYQVYYPGCPITIDATEPTSFNRATVLPTETKAGRALWALATLNDDWKRRVLHLGALCLSSRDDNLYLSNNLDALSDAEDRCPQFDALRGWLRMSKTIGAKHYAVTERTCWCVPIVWSFLVNEDASFIVAEWFFGGDLSDHYRKESAIFTIEIGSYNGSPCINWSALEEARCFKFCNNDPPSLGDKLRRREEERETIRRALTQIELSMIKSICNHLALPRDKCKRLSTCLRQVLRALGGDKTDQRAKALAVLWLCAGFMAVDPTFVDPLVTICKNVIDRRRVDEVFWATCLLLSMLSWLDVREESHRARCVELLELAANSVCVLLKSSDWPKFVFLAKYLVVKELEEMGPACIPFLVASFERFKGVDKSLNNESIEEASLNDDSYFQSECYRRSAPIDERQLSVRCLWRLRWLWPNHKSEITTEGGVPVLRAMLKYCAVDDAIESDIKQTLQDKTMDSVKEDTKQTLQDAAP